MPKITHYLAMPLVRDKSGVVVGAALEALSADEAIWQAFRLAMVEGGAVAVSRTGDSDRGEFEKPVVLATYDDWRMGTSNKKTLSRDHILSRALAAMRDTRTAKRLLGYPA